MYIAFAFGLLGSFHCVGMCGALALALPDAHVTGARWLAGRLTYHAGRLATYAVLGGLVGTLGRGLQVFGWQQGLSVTAGLLMLLLVLWPLVGRTHTARVPGVAGLLRWLQPALAKWFQRPGLGALLLAGALNGLLPCGLVYLALAGALAAPDSLGGALYMLLFGLGTLPLLLVVAWSGRLVPAAVRHRLQRVVPWAAATLAVLFIVRGLGLGIPYLSPAAGFATPGVYEPTMCHGEPPSAP